MKPISNVIALVSLCGLLAPACLSRPIELIEPNRSVVINEALTQSKVDKIDILLAIDDSGSMADKQDILAFAVPDLVGALVNPNCVDTEGAVVSTPAGPLEECAAGSRREFEPVLDIHIGVISSSMGTRGSPWRDCPNDGGKLLSRTELAADQPTFEDKGFLVWEPEVDAPVPGQYTDPSQLTADLSAMVRGVGQVGCGHEAQLESWYRFLVDPKPHASVSLDETGRSTPTGVDESLLAQRADFLRPDSLVAIVMLSDENDCSYRSDSFGYFTTGNVSGRGVMGLVPRAECASNPNDPCCAPCGHASEQCEPDPTCDTRVVANDEQLVNLTCFDQKRRYGIDFLYPTSRYVAGLTQKEIEDRDGEIHPTPLLVSANGLNRGRDRVFLAGIVGVPWQLLARDPTDLTKGFQNKSERDSSGVWDAILGDPVKNVPRTDPHMIESPYPREGLAGTTAGPSDDPFHGHEYDPHMDASASDKGDLQYACTFELPDPIPCGADLAGCTDCRDSDNNPLCQASDGSYGNEQLRAKAYPGRRQLSVLKDLGDQGIVGSICPAQLTTAGAKDYGYLPAIEALVERLKVELSGPCLARSIKPNPNKQVDCIVLEAQNLPDGGACNCDYAAGRIPVDAAHQQAVVEAMQRETSQAAELDCFCEIEQLEEDALQVCQNSVDEEPRLGDELVHGWCYVDATTDQPVGNEELVSHCQPSERRAIRFVNSGEPINDAHVFITCQQ